MFTVPPPPHPDEHLMHSRTRSKIQDAEDAKGHQRGRRVSRGDVVLLLGLALALAAVIAFLVLGLF